LFIRDEGEGETVGESNRSSGVERKLSAYLRLGDSASVAAAVARRRRCRRPRGLVHVPLVRRASVSSSVGLLVRVRARSTRPKVADVRRSRPRRRGAARRPKTSRLRISPVLPFLPLHSRLRARCTRTCARASCVCVCGVVCLCVCLSVSAVLCVRLCASSARVLARERAAEERGTSANGSSQDYSKPRKYEHCCPITSRRVH